MLTRLTLRERLGLSETKLKSLEQTGLVRSTARNDRGRALYTEATFKKLRSYLAGRAMPGGSKMEIEYQTDEAQKVFKHLRDGTPLAEIVIQSAIHPTIVDAIKEDWADFTGAIILSRTIVDKLRALAPSAPLDGPDDVYAMIRHALRRFICPRCREADRADACLDCIYTHLAAKAKRLQDEQQAPSEPVGPTGPTDEPSASTD